MTEHNMREDGKSIPLSRRKILAMSAGAATGLAGCSGDDGDGSDGGGVDTTATPTEVGEMGLGTATPTPTAAEDETATSKENANGDPYPNPEGEILDETLNVPHDTSWDPTSWNANAFAENSSNGAPWEFGFNVQAADIALNGTFPLIGLDKLEVKNGGCTVVWEMRDGDHWWDGTPVTNRDWLTHQKLQMYQQFGPNPHEETKDSPAYNGPELEIEGDKRIIFNRRSPINRQEALLNARAYWFDVKHDYYKKFLERFEDATTVDENDQISQDLIEHTVSFEKFSESLGNGLWKPKDWSEISVTFERHEGNPRYEWTNIPEAKLRMIPDTQKRVSAYKNGNFDMGISAQDPIRNIMDQIPDMNMIREFPYIYTRGLRFNFREETEDGVNHTSRRGVRRAIAYLMDQEKLQESQMSANGYKTFPLRNHGMARGVGKKFLGQDFIDNLIDYGMTTKEEKAKEELENAGYTKQNGEWVGPEGNPLSFSIQTGSPPRKKVSVQFITSHLQRYGINAEPQFVSGSNYWNNLTTDFNKLPGAVAIFGGGPYPSEPYVNWNGQVVELPSQVAELRETGSVEDCGTGEITAPKLKRETTPRWERPVRPEFPKEVGDPAAPEDTETQRLQPFVWDWTLEETQSSETIREIARKFAWYQNWQVTDMPYYTESWSQAGDTVNFFWGDGSFNEDWCREPYRQWWQGVVQGRTESHNGDPEGPMEP